MNSPRDAASHRWLPVALSIVSGLWLFIATGLFIAAGGAPYLVFVAPVAAAPGVAQLFTRTPSRALYSAAFFCVLAAFVFTTVTFIVFAPFAMALALPTVCLGVAWRLTRPQTAAGP